MSAFQQDMVSTCNKLYAQGFLPCLDGNVSIKTSQDKICITPKGRSKQNLNPEDLALMSLDGSPLKGDPSSESQMHLAIYQNQPEAQAVVHAHPPYSVALSVARPKWKELPLVLPEVVVLFGSIPFVPYAQPGTANMGDALIPHIKKCKAVVLSHHGACTWGRNLEEAYRLMEGLEHACKIIFFAESLGGAQTLSLDSIKNLLK